MILSTMEQVAAEQNKTLRPLTDDTELLETGLDSLCFAILVARLEDRLGYDPFSMSDDVEFPITLGDFFAAYDNVKLDA
jgi:acyl carrier protein